MSEHELWNELGNLYFMSGAHDQAVHAYHRSIQVDESYGRPYSNLALIYAQQGRYDKAVGLFRRSLDLLVESREKAVSWNRLGNLYRQAKQYDEAVTAFQRADELEPECKDGREELGQMLYATSDLTILDRALELKRADDGKFGVHELDEYLASGRSDAGDEIPVPPGEPDANWFAPLLDADLGEEELEAFLAYQQAEDTAPSDDVDRNSNIDGGDAVEKDDRPPSAPEPLEEAEQSALAPVTVQAPEKGGPDGPAYTYPVSAVPSRSLARKQVRLPDLQVAVDLLERPAAGDDSGEEASGQDGGTKAESERIEMETPTSTAFSRDGNQSDVDIAKHKRMVQINPRNASAWDSLGTLHKSAGDYQQALLAFQQAISIDPARADYYHHLGLVHAIQGHNEDAIIALQKVLELAPDHSLAHATLGGYYKKMGLDELAQNHIGKAMRSIYDSESEYNRACLAAICGDVDEAVQLLRIALENRQTYAEWVIHDPDMDFIRNDPRFKQLVSEYTR